MLPACPFEAVYHSLVCTQPTRPTYAVVTLTRYSLAASSLGQICCEVECRREINRAGPACHSYRPACLDWSENSKQFFGGFPTSARRCLLRPPKPDAARFQNRAWATCYVEAHPAVGCPYGLGDSERLSHSGRHIGWKRERLFEFWGWFYRRLRS